MIAAACPDDRNVPYSRVMDVTPESAFRWLEGNTHNRPINQAHVDSLARDMKAGRWQLTHQGIAFDTTGLLIDGQHRLCAVIDANMTITMRVFFNEPPENRRVLDSGRQRSNLDILSLTGQVGEVTTKHLATLRAMLSGLSFHPTRRTACEEANLFQRHRDAIDFAIQHLGACLNKGVSTSQTRAVVARAYYSVDQNRLIHFCDVLRSGLPADEADHVILALRDFLIRTAGAGRGDSAQRLRYGKTEWALDAFLDGRTPKRLCGADAELFPVPEDAERSEVQPTELRLAEAS
jgi:hypothetical protein